MTYRVYVMTFLVMTFLVVLGLATLAQAQTFTVLYSFAGDSDGGNPYAGVIRDPAGNLYGNTYDGGDLQCGSEGCGTVYEISSAGAETVLYRFKGGKDGDTPVTPLLQDSKGTLYGTTQSGGPGGWGTVFKIDTAGHETVLHSLAGGDGCYPDQGLVMGRSGIMFGTTNQCGSHGIGTIFKVEGARTFTVLYSFIQSPYGGRPGGGRLTRDKSGNLYGVTEGGGHNEGALYELAANGAPRLLHGFKGGTKDGCIPFGSVVRDSSGTLYGTTYSCGSANYGTVWKVSNKGKETILHNFAGGVSDGCNPEGSVVWDKAGNLYGTTSRCGSDNEGAIWKVSRKGKETILHNFAGGTSDGCYPAFGVTRDSEGNLYGLAFCGINNYGALYELSASGTFSLLQRFDGSDGYYPYGEVLRTARGALYGTTEVGGAYGVGTVWKYVP